MVLEELPPSLLCMPTLVLSTFQANLPLDYCPNATSTLTLHTLLLLSCTSGSLGWAYKWTPSFFPSFLFHCFFFSSEIKHHSWGFSSVEVRWRKCWLLQLGFAWTSSFGIPAEGQCMDLQGFFRTFSESEITVHMEDSIWWQLLALRQQEI